jgi:hypothetical protein
MKREKLNRCQAIILIQRNINPIRHIKYLQISIDAEIPGSIPGSETGSTHVQCFHSHNVANYTNFYLAQIHSISAVTSEPATIIRTRSSTALAGESGTNT